MALSEIPIDKGVYKANFSRAVRNSGYAEDLVNMMLDAANANFDRPTLKPIATLTSGNVIGASFFDRVFVFVTADRNVFTVHPVTHEVIQISGTVLPGHERAVFANDGTSLYIVGGGTPLKWDGQGTLTEDLGGDPPEFSHIIFVDGYLVGNRRSIAEGNKVAQFSEFEDSEDWNGTNIFSNNAGPDETQGVAVSQRDLYFVGQKTTEIWQNVGTSPVPFARSLVWQYGTPAPYSIISEDNSVFFMDQTRKILRFSGSQYTRLSEAIENELSTYNIVDDCVASSFTFKGSVHVCFTFPSEGKMWSVDLKNGQWTEWRGYNKGWARPRVNALFYSEDVEKAFVGDFGSGEIYELSETESTDAGGIFKRLRTFSHRDGGAAIRKRANLLRINMDRNVASSFSGEPSDTNPMLELRWRDENKPWSPFRQLSLGEIGQSKGYSEFRKLGIFRIRQYQLQISDPAKLRIASIETEEDVMTS